MLGIYEQPEIIGAFIDELEEQLQLLEEGILELEQDSNTKETIRKIIRVAHTLKGSSATMGFEKMKLLTHEMESILERIGSDSLCNSKPIIDTLLQCADYLKVLRNEFITNKNDIKTDISSILKKLHDICFKESTEYIYEDKKGKNNENQNIDNSLKISMEPEEIKKIEQSKKQGLNNFICEVKISQESMMKSTRACLILNYFNEIGTIIKSNPDVLEDCNDDDMDIVYYMISTGLSKNELELKSNNELMDIEYIKISEYSDDCNIQSKVENVDNSSISSNIEKKVNQTVRVDIERLEKLMNLVGELVIENTRITQVGSDLYNQYSSDSSVGELLDISNHVSRVIGELQEGVMKTRMLPIQQLFSRFPRMVRDLSQSLNKKVDLVLEGGETEIDRTIIEDITDPLIHIIRNAIDHGLELPEIRRSANKEEKGIIKITAFHQENHVIITVEDDGSGIDVDKIKKSAVNKEIISNQDADNLTDDEAINLIFHPGFSTSSVVSDVSGRGVGMDIVRSHIGKVNGLIDIETKKGFGTKFTIKLPLTLAILPGLLIKINEDTYSIPMSNVIEIVRKPKEDIEFIKGKPVALIREKVLPLIWLHDYFNIERNDKGKNVFIVVLRVAEKRFGLIVDKLIGNQEIVVKSLGSYIGKVDGFLGATIIGDGSVACILDVVGISKMILNHKTINSADKQK